MDDSTLTRTRGQPINNAAGHLSSHDFREAFGEDLTSTLDLSTWRAGRDLAAEYRRIEAEIAEAVECEGAQQKRVRQHVFPRLSWAPAAPRGAGVYPAVRGEELSEIHSRLLFPGRVEACDGTCEVHDTLALTVYQIGVGLVSYRGDEGTWHTRLFRRDLRLRNADPVEEALEILERRQQRDGLHAEARDDLSQLARRGLMTYAERAVLARRATSPWRLGHGSPAPYELFLGTGYADLMIESVKVIRELVEGHKKFVFVTSEPNARHLLTIGQALRPCEFAIVETLRDRIGPFLDEWQARVPATVDTSWDGVRLAPEQWVARFRDVVAAQVVVGIFRATRLSPPHVFYAHIDHAADAAKIAIADSVLQEQRGFPLLIDLADRVCRSVYGGGSLREMAGSAYAAAGVPFRYGSERGTRGD